MASRPLLIVTLYFPPKDFEDAGRISIIADLQGAVFAIFQSAHRQG